MAIVVSDTSPVVALAHLDLLDVLCALFGSVLIPPAVNDELRARRPAIDVSPLEFIEVRAPRDRAQVESFLADLDPGESEALALALEVGATVVLIDESLGRAAAKQVGLTPLGTLGTLLRAKQRSLVTSLQPLLNQLQDELGFFLSPEVRRQILRLAGE